MSENNKNNSNAYFLLGNAQLIEKDYTSSLEAYEKAVSSLLNSSLNKAAVIVSPSAIELCLT